MKAKEFNTIAQEHNSKIQELHKKVYTIDFFDDNTNFNIFEQTFLEYLANVGGDFGRFYINDGKLKIYTANLGKSGQNTAECIQENFSDDFQRWGLGQALESLAYTLIDTSENNPEFYTVFEEAKKAAEEWVKDNA